MNGITQTETRITEHLIGKLTVFLVLMYPIKFNCGPADKLLLLQPTRKKIVSIHSEDEKGTEC